MTTPLHIGIAGVSGEGAAHRTPLVAAGILFAPLFHRVMHRFHLGEQERARRRAQGGR